MKEVTFLVAMTGFLEALAMAIDNDNGGFFFPFLFLD